MANFDLDVATILLTLAGSHVHGLDRPSSDVDVAGIAIPPQTHSITLRSEWEQDDGQEVADLAFRYLKGDCIRDRAKDNGCEGTIYNLKKYMILALKANPTIWNAMFCEDEEVLKITPAGRYLRANRNIFVSQQAKNSFIGYAISQLKRIERHKKWLDNPPTKPSREDRGLPVGGAVLNKEQVAGFGTIGPEKMLELGLSQKLVEMIQEEKLYARDMDQWKKFNAWRKHRNPARAELEAAAGYDTKHAMHLMRLLNMGYEIMKDGVVNVWREDDGAELLAIRDGHRTYGEIVGRGEDIIQEIEDMAHASELPKKPDFEQVEELYQELLEIHYGAPC